MFEKEGFSDWFKENTPKEGLSENTTFTKQFLIDAWNNGYSQKIIKLQKELEEEKKLNAEIKARFVKCNTCTDEMKSKCLMFTENLCEGERCEELIDIVSLVNKSDLERKIEALEKANEWHYPSKGELPKEDKRYLCKIKAFVGSGITYECFDYDSEYSSWKGASGEVIAWKEIVLPELPKESE